MKTAGSNYWYVRGLILKAISEDNDKDLKDLAAEHPKIFKELCNQAKNSRFKIQKPPEGPDAA